jgi:hypothetical protein
MTVRVERGAPGCATMDAYPSNLVVPANANECLNPVGFKAWRA